MNIVKGSVVRSLAGRDQDRYYVAVSVEDRFILVSDGKWHKLESPKKKNVKHISPTSIAIATENMTDKKLRKLLFELKTQGPKEVGSTDNRKKEEI